jgi:hypothetical protein
MWHKPAISKHQHTLSASKGHSLFVNKALLALAPAPALETLSPQPTTDAVIISSLILALALALAALALLQ